LGKKGVISPLSSVVVEKEYYRGTSGLEAKESNAAPIASYILREEGKKSLCKEEKEKNSPLANASESMPDKGNEEASRQRDWRQKGGGILMR